MIIRIGTDNTIEELPFPGNTSCVRDELKKMIGCDCTCFEHVYPRRMYEDLEQCRTYGKRPLVLVDEDGYRKKLPKNPIASWLYCTDLHGNAILGDVLIVREHLVDGMIDLQGLEKGSVREILEGLRNITAG